MKYLSVCSGMEAATVAWHPLGWEPVGFSEIEPFPSAILKHRFPNTPNYGDLTQHHTWPIEPGTIDILAGGTPCQSFSVAGLRRGLEDPRGNLALTFLGLADRLRPRWIVWENVPGVLSSNGGRDFASFLGALGQLGYGWAYRVLDAQYFGVPQRRRRVFVVATSSGDGRLAGEVLSLPEGLRGYIEARRKKGQGAPSGPAGGVDADGLQSTVGTLCADTHPGAYSKQDAYTGRLIPEQKPVPFRKARRAQSKTDHETWVEGDVSNTLNTFDLTGDTRTTHAVVEPYAFTQNQREEVRILGDKTGSLSAAGGTHQTNYVADVAPTVTSSGTPYSPTGNERVESEAIVAFQPGNLRRQAGADPSTEVFPTVKCDAGDQTPHICYPLKDPNDIACDAERRQNGIGENGDPAFTLRTAVKPGVATAMAVRRLTPVECERLQGFPDNWSRIPWKGKPEEDCPDGPRYKACGNSMAVPVMRWIGSRIAEIEGKVK